MPSPLHAVPTPGAKPPAKRRTTALRRAAGKSRRDMLVALRNRIAADIDAGVAARDLSSLSRRLMDIAAELDEIDALAGAAAGSGPQSGRPVGVGEAAAVADEQF